MQMDMVNSNLKEENKKVSIFYIFSKRAIDILGSTVGLVLLSPILLIAAIAIKIESKGPVIFSQQRIGLKGKKFKMYKLRSMVENAEKQFQ